MFVIEKAHGSVWAGVFLFLHLGLACTPAAEEVEQQHLEQARAQAAETSQERPDSQSIKPAKQIT